MHHHALLIIPKDIYEQGHIAIDDYIYHQLNPYSEYFKVDEYIAHTKAELEKDFAEFQDDKDFAVEHQKYTSLEDFCTKWCEYKLDLNGNALSTSNPKAFWDWYEIGGRWSGELTNKSTDNIDQNLYSVLELHIINRMPHNIKNNSISITGLLSKYKNDKKTYKILLHEDDNYETILNKYHNDYAISINYHN